MKIQFLGTGAADWDWSRPLSTEVRGSSCTLFDDKILIDAGETAWENILRFGVSPDKISHILITHTHMDHFNPVVIKKIAEAAGRTTKLHVYASPEGISQLDHSVMNTTELSFGDKFSIYSLDFEVLSANHMLKNEMEAAYHFLITTPENKRLLYTLDGGWMTSYTRNKLGFNQLHMIIWDATSGTSLKDWRFADHNDLEMIQFMREALTARTIVNDSTVHVFTHIARTLWPLSAEERQKAASQYKGILVDDGDILNL